ncbi:MAG: EFR1 family ferrodoxin [Sarcina sp.]
MNIKIFYYTSTGNSLYIAKRIASNIENSELIKMKNVEDKNELEYSCESAIFIYPIHCFGLPVIAANFIEKIKLTKCNYIYSLAVSGGDDGKLSAKQLNRMLSKFGGIQNYGTVKYESNYIKSKTLNEIKAKEYDITNEVVIDRIIQEIKNKKKVKVNTSFRPYSNFVWRKFFKGKDNKFTVNSECVGCNICTRVCPADNIKLENSSPIFTNKCVDCMSCINLCPKNAINLGKKTIKRPRYKNKNIKIDELFNK